MSPTQPIYTNYNMKHDNTTSNNSPSNTENVYVQIEELRNNNSILLLRLSQLEDIVHNLTNNLHQTNFDHIPNIEDEQRSDGEGSDDEFTDDEMPALEGDSNNEYFSDEQYTDNCPSFINNTLFASHANFIII